MKLFIYSLFVPLAYFSQNLSLTSPLRILALGDSYTIGQNVAVNERWPVQLKDSLAARGFVTSTLTIIATTGWRTDNLLNAINGQHLQQQNYNLVTLLIGVNNQFQGSPFSQYKTEFRQLLDSAIRYAGGVKSHVCVLSIPDYAFTPFGQQSQNASQISSEIDLYNFENKQVADSAGIKYFDITGISRQGVAQPSYVANDGLHPSGIQYSRWVKLMLNHIDAQIATGIERSGEKASKTFVFPNPVKDFLSISTEGGSTQAATIELFNLTGSRVFYIKANQNRTELTLRDLPTGLYLLKISNASGSEIHKVVKQ